MTLPGEEEVGATESVSRFVYDSDKVKSSGRVLPGAYLPMRHEGRFETSVCRLALCSDDRAWELGRTQRTDKRLYARADLDASVIRSTPLRCIANPVPGFAEHALIVDWPDDKPTQKALALQLATGSTGRLAT